MAEEVGTMRAGTTAQGSCEVVRRFLMEAVFGGDERALRQTVADPVLQERVWLFWAAFTDRRLDAIDVLFADADGTWVGCHATGVLRQVGPYLDGLAEPDGELAERECTGVYGVSADKIVSAHEAWR